MADSIVRLRVDSQEYDAKLKRAAQGLASYIDGCRKVGGTLEVVEKETLQYVQALGRMDTTSRSAKGRLGEMTKAFTDLAMQYNHLTEQEKSSPFGVALSQGLEQLKGRVRDTGAELNAIKASIDGAGNSLDDAGQRTLNLAAKMQSIQAAFTGFQQLAGVVDEQVEAYKAQEEAELKLQTVMRQRMKASDDEVESIKRLAAAQQEQGVIGDEVQLAGAQQVATFLSEKKSIETLLPAMNNLAAQRKGLNVTAEDMVSIGNLVGKVMQGQVSALTRVGITFTEAEQKVLKYGDEQERAAMLAQVITNNVGQMNHVLAQTDAGRAKQLANAFGDQREKVGQALAKYQVYIQTIGQVGMAVTGVSTVVTALKGLATTTGLATLATKAFGVVQTAFAGVATLVTAAVNGTTLSVTALRTAIRGTIASFGIVGVAYMALSGILGKLVEQLGLFGGASDDATRAADRMTEAERRQAAAAEENQRVQARNKDVHGQTGRAVDELVGKYRTLQAQWNALKTEGDKTKWVKDNQSAFSELGMSVGDVNDAYDYFVKNSKRVVDALTAIAEADAWKDIYKKDMEKAAEARRGASVKNGGYYVRKRAGDEVTLGEAQAAGIDVSQWTKQKRFSRIGHRDGIKQNVALYRLNAAEAARLTEYNRQRASSSWNATMSPYEKNAAQSRAAMQRAQERAMRLQGAAGLGQSGTGADTSSTTARGGGHADTGTTKAREQEISSEITALKDAYVTASEERREAIRGEIKELNAELAVIKELKAEAEGKSVGFNAREFLQRNPGYGEGGGTVQEQLGGITSSLGDADFLSPKLRIDTSQIKAATQDADKMKGSWREAAQAIQGVGSAMSQIENPAARVVATIAQAIASVALGAGEALSKHKGGPWSWIAAAASVTATMISTIAAIHSATGYASGGIVDGRGGGTVGGSNPSGDLVPARLNSGELILNRAQQGNLAAQLDGMGGLGQLRLTATLSGEDMRVALSNNARRRGRGEYVTTRDKAW